VAANLMNYPVFIDAEIVLRESEAGDMLRTKFGSIKDVHANIKEFISLPVTAVKEILRNPFFQTDSENSIFTIVMLWINKDIEVKESIELAHHLKELLPLVYKSRFSSNCPFGILIDDIVNPDKEFANGILKKALEILLSRKVFSSLVPLIDNSYFSDCTLYIMDMDAVIRKIRVSKFCLARRSRYFNNLFQKNPENNTFLILMTKEKSKSLIKLLSFIYSLYTKEVGILDLKICELGLRFDVPDVFKNFTIQTLEDLSHLYNFIEQNEYLRTFKATEELQRIAAEFIKVKFGNIIFEYKKKEFRDLPVLGIMEILKNLSLEKDPKVPETAFTIIMLWIEEDKKKREIYLKILLPLVDMSFIALNYLLKEVSPFIDGIENQDISIFAMRKYKKEVETRTIKAIFRFDPRTMEIAELKRKVIEEGHPFQTVKQILDIRHDFYLDDKRHSENLIILPFQVSVEIIEILEIVQIGEEEIEDHDNYLGVFLSLVDFSTLETYFFLENVSNIIGKIVNPEIQQFAKEIYAKELERRLR